MALNTIIDDILQGKGRPAVNLSGLKITPQQLDQITSAAAYTGNYNVLVLSNCGLTPSHIDVLKGKGFTSLTADNNPTLGTEGGKRIAALNFNYVDISYCNAGNQLNGFRTGPLNYLKMRGGAAGGMTVPGIIDVMANPNVTQINLSGNALNFGNAGCLKIAANTRMTNINLRGCDAMDDTAALLSKNGNLRMLDLSNCRNMTEAGMRSVGEIGSLTHLTLVGMYVPATEALRLNKNLEVVDLNFNYHLGDAGFAAMATPERLAKFKSLSLFSTGITNASVDLMLQMPNLTFVEIGENPISYEKSLQLKALVQANRDRIFGTSLANTQVANLTSYAGKKWAEPTKQDDIDSFDIRASRMAGGAAFVSGFEAKLSDKEEVERKQRIHGKGDPSFWNQMKAEIASKAFYVEPSESPSV